VALVPVAEFSDRIAADVARLTLAAEGIEAVIFDGGMASLGLGLMTPARLMIDEVDAVRARLVLEGPR
jgi:Putative prokaryotic signal transducing protein